MFCGNGLRQYSCHVQLLEQLSGRLTLGQTQWVLKAAAGAVRQLHTGQENIWEVHCTAITLTGDLLCARPSH